ncbi:MAG: chromate transporter [Clostridia bacterium]|nr:chromate transporter [Clostridia bacterium]
MIYLEIFWCYFQIGLFSIGGGHAALPVVQSMVVEQRGWLTLPEFIGMITISEIAPGALAINTATYVGVTMGGILGGIIATLSCMLPSFIIVLTLACLYTKYSQLAIVSGALDGIRPAVTALIGVSGMAIMLLTLFDTTILTEIRSVDCIALVIALICLGILRWKKPNPVLVILGAGILGVFGYGLL